MSVSSDSEHDQAPVPDGAVIELARDDLARKRFLKMAGKTMGGAAAATALGTFIAACGSSSSSSKAGAAASTATSATGAATTAGDLQIVNYALTLEYLEAQFYKDVIGSGLFSSSPALPTIKQFGQEETEHVAALLAVAQKLGTPAKKPVAKFPLANATDVTKLAAAVENLGAAAYLGQAASIKSKEILAAALAIHTVEARHAAVLNLTLKLTPTPDGGFGKPMSMQQVLAVVKPFIVG
jgi:hypothetical protein